MSERREAVRAGMEALMRLDHEWHPKPLGGIPGGLPKLSSSNTMKDYREATHVVLDAAEPAIRADERRKVIAELGAGLAELELHDDLPDSHDIGYMGCWRDVQKLAASLLAPEGEGVRNSGAVRNPVETLLGASSEDEREAAPFEIADRGFKHYEPIVSNSGDEVRVYESSAADAPYLWLRVNEATAHLRLADVERLIASLKAGIANHYQQPAPSVGKEGGGRRYRVVDAIGEAVTVFSIENEADALEHFERASRMKRAPERQPLRLQVREIVRSPWHDVPARSEVPGV